MIEPGSQGSQAPENATPAQVASRSDFFVEPEAGIRPVIGALESARQSISLVVYLLSDDRVISALQRAKERGVKVRVMVESHPFGGSQGNRKSYDKLQRLGIDIRYTPNRFRFTHEKAFVIDHKLALITTANFTRSAFSKNREYGYFDTTPSEVKEVEAIFDADWADRPITPREPRLVVSPSNSRQKIVDLIRSARRSLLVQDETCSDPQVIGAIADRVKAGLEVQVQVEEAKDLGRLQAAGIPARRMESHYLHAKTVIADGQRAYMGSENLTANSLDNNRELGILTTDPGIVGALTQTVRADWNQ